MCISAAELLCMQASAVIVLDKTCTITRVGSGTDTWGSPNSGTTSQIGGTIACMLNKPSPQVLAQYASKVLGRIAWDVALPVGTNVLAGDTINIGTRKLKVEAVLDLESFLILLHVLAVEVL
jgi:hypothetical protein